ncbi:hypothetical protein CBS101457_003052 [Exobasidium rhododendri]|nr:hypothetical protein CBS101457_003052 [Exobasidium rhododendri]
MLGCSQCSKSYVRAEHLRRHIDTTHPKASDPTSERKEHRCNYSGCGRSFLRSDALLRHKRGHERKLKIFKIDQDVGKTEDQCSNDASPMRGDEISPASASVGIASSSSLSDRDVANFGQRSLDSLSARNDSKTGQWTQQFSPEMNQEVLMQATIGPALGSSRQRHDDIAGFQLPTNSLEPMYDPQVKLCVEDLQQQQQYQDQTSMHSVEMHAPNIGLLDRISYTDWEEESTRNFGDQTFTGLDWFFDDMTDISVDTAVVPDLADVLQGTWQGRIAGAGDLTHARLDNCDNDEIFGGSNTALDTTETLNLLNLANTALSLSSTAAGQQRKEVAGLSRPDGFHQGRGGQRVGSQQQALLQEEDDSNGEDSWPQEFCPSRRKPPTIELSVFTLADLSKEKEADCTPSDFMILIDDCQEDQRASLQWTIHDETRLKLLSYLTHSCRHPWSIYSFSSAPPSTFLTTSQLEKLVSLFFAKFQLFVPLIHAATFDPNTAPPILLLSVITIGFVFYPSEMKHSISSTDNDATSPSFSQLRKTASTLSVAFSELVRIGVMSAYEADQRGFTDVSINQAWLLQQIFGIGSGDKRLNKLAERNRGGIVTAVRRLGLLSQSNDPSLSGMPGTEKGGEKADDDPSSTLQSKWKSWIASETRLRLGWFVYLYDQKFSTYLDVAPMFRYTEINAPMPCHVDLWNANSAEAWMYRQRTLRVEESSRKNLLDPLRQLLQTSSPSAPLHLSPLEAYILSVTLYRIRWDASKEKILFDDDSSISDKGTDCAATQAMQRLSKAAEMRSGSRVHQQSMLPLATEVQLLNLLATLHFTGPPLLFDKLRDAAGRSGMSSERRQGAIRWLQAWIDGSEANQIKMRRILLASAQIHSIVHSSFKVDMERRYKSGMQSNICTMSLFHAALGMWAYTQFARGAGEYLSVAASSTTNVLPRLTDDQVASVGRAGCLDLFLTPRFDDNSPAEYDDSSLQRRDTPSPSRHAQLVEAWIHGKYESFERGEVCPWPLSSSAIRIEGIGALNGDMDTAIAKSKTNSTVASHVLERFALLLARHDWGLAASFRLILLYMARHAVK